MSRADTVQVGIEYKDIDEWKTQQTVCHVWRSIDRVMDDILRAMFYRYVLLINTVLGVKSSEGISAIPYVGEFAVYGIYLLGVRTSAMISSCNVQLLYQKLDTV